MNFSDFLTIHSVPKRQAVLQVSPKRGKTVRPRSVPQLIEALNARGFSFGKPNKTRSGTIQVSESKPYEEGGGAFFTVSHGRAFFHLLNNPVSIANVDDIIHAIEANERNSTELYKTGKISGSMARYDESRDAPGLYPISSLRPGAYFKRTSGAKKVYRKGDYDRSGRTYAGLDTDDISRSIALKGDTRVYVGFDY